MKIFKLFLERDLEPYILHPHPIFLTDRVTCYLD